MRTYSADGEASEFCGRKLGGIVMINDATGMPCVVPSAAEVLFAESLRCFVNSCVYRRLPGGRRRFGLSALHTGGGRRRPSEAEDQFGKNTIKQILLKVQISPRRFLKTSLFLVGCDFTSVMQL